MPHICSGCQSGCPAWKMENLSAESVGAGVASHKPDTSKTSNKTSIAEVNRAGLIPDLVSFI